jgi:type II secretory pathway pseudopilin PulG
MRDPDPFFAMQSGKAAANWHVQETNAASNMKTVANNKAARRPGARAFTLVEVLMGVGLVGIMFFVLYAGITNGFAVIQLARENLRATQILQEKTEAIRLVTWDQLNAAGFVPTTFTEPFYPTGTQSTSGLTYEGTFRMEPAPITNAFYAPDLRQVTFEVRWNSGGVQRSRHMTTYVSRYGLYRYRY